jgi:hypothetical protein
VFGPCNTHDKVKHEIRFVWVMCVVKCILEHLINNWRVLVESTKDLQVS